MFMKQQAIQEVFRNAMNGDLLQLLIKTHLGVDITSKAVCSPLGGSQDSRDKPHHLRNLCCDGIRSQIAKVFSTNLPQKGTKSQLGPSEKSNCAILPHSSDASVAHVLQGRFGERLVELQMPSETIPHKSWVEMKNERLSTEAWPPATCTPKQHQKLLSHNNLHISCATTSASHPVNTFLPLKKSGHTKLPAHCQPLPLPIHPSRFTLVSIPKTWIRSYHSHG